MRVSVVPGGHPPPSPGNRRARPMLDVASRTAAGAAGAGVELDYEAVAPAVFALRARLDVAHQRGRRLGPHHTRAADEICRADPPPHAWLDQEVLHPMGAQAVLGDQVVAAAAAREPDLDLMSAAGLPP